MGMRWSPTGGYRLGRWQGRKVGSSSSQEGDEVFTPVEVQTRS